MNTELQRSIMKSDVKTALERDFTILPIQTARATIHRAAREAADVIEAIAVCKLDCYKNRTGNFAIPKGADLGCVVLRKALRHAKSCRVAQSLKEQRRHQGIWPKSRRYVRKTVVEEEKEERIFDQIFG